MRISTRMPRICKLQIIDIRIFVSFAFPELFVFICNQKTMSAVEI